MRKKSWIQILTGVLALQAVLVVVGTVGAVDRGALVSDEPLLRFDASRLDEIRLAAGEESVTLRKVEGAWQLPDYHAFPADALEVERLLDQLADLRPGWPVATSGAAAERFKVADDAFERRIALLAGGEPAAELFIGTSPGFRKVHARADGSNDIHSVELRTYEASTKPADWIDHLAFERDPAKLSRIDVGALTLLRDGDAWRLDALETGTRTRAEEARKLVERIAKLRVEDVLGTEVKPEYRQDAPALRVTVHPTEGAAVVYTLSQSEGADDFVLKVSDRPHVVKVASYNVDPIAKVDRAQLVEPDEPEPAGAEGSGDAPQAGASTDGTGDTQPANAPPTDTGANGEAQPPE
jgi:hypothetical protein